MYLIRKSFLTIFRLFRIVVGKSSVCMRLYIVDSQHPTASAASLGLKYNGNCLNCSKNTDEISRSRSFVSVPMLYLIFLRSPVSRSILRTDNSCRDVFPVGTVLSLHSSIAICSADSTICGQISISRRIVNGVVFHFESPNMIRICTMASAAFSSRLSIAFSISGLMMLKIA